MGLGMLQKWQGPLPCSPELSPTPYTLEFPGSGPTCSMVTDGSRQAAFLPTSQILCMAILILPPHFLHIDLIKRQRPHRRPVPRTLSVCCSLPPSWAPQHILTCHKQKKQSPLHLWQHFVFIFAGLILQNGNSSFYNLGFPVTIKAEDFYLYQLAICKCFRLLVCFMNCRSISFTHFSIHLCFCPFFTNLTPLFSRFQHLPPWTKTSSTWCCISHLFLKILENQLFNASLPTKVRASWGYRGYPSQTLLSPQQRAKACHTFPERRNEDSRVLYQLGPARNSLKGYCWREFHKGPFIEVGARLERPGRRVKSLGLATMKSITQPMDEDEERTGVDRQRLRSRRETGRCHSNLKHHNSMIRTAWTVPITSSCVENLLPLNPQYLILRWHKMGPCVTPQQMRK